MSLNDAILNVGCDAMRLVATHLGLHSAAPDASGSNRCASALVAAGWPVAVAGDTAVANKAFTGVVASGPVTHIGFWNAAGTVFYGAQSVTGDLSANSAGEYTVTSVQLNGTAN